MSLTYPSDSSSRTHDTHSNDRQLQSAEKIRSEVDRKLAMACLAAFTLLFSLITWMFQEVTEPILESETEPPKFLTEIPSGSNEEWMLLPGVGKKTAEAWRRDLPSGDNPQIVQKALDNSTVPTTSDKTPLVVLEDLRGVGPNRAKQLEPYIANAKAQSDSNSSEKLSRKKPKNKLSREYKTKDKQTEESP